MASIVGVIAALWGLLLQAWPWFPIVLFVVWYGLVCVLVYALFIFHRRATNQMVVFIDQLRIRKNRQ